MAETAGTEPKTAEASEPKEEVPSADPAAATEEGAVPNGGGEKAEAEADPKKRAGPESEEAQGADAKKLRPTVAPKPKELEEDAPEDTGARVSGEVAIHPQDTTPNVFLTGGGKLLMSLTDGGFQYLLAGARANIGLTSGRYFFEAVIVEAHGPSGAAAHKNQDPSKPLQQLVRLGFATEGAHLLLPEASTDMVCFNSEGIFISGKAKTKVSQHFGRDQVMALVLNLDKGSPNANTVSLFRDGRRVSTPQKLPEHLIGRPLFPAISFRGATVKVNFGPVPLKPFAFRCRMVADASASDATILPAPPKTTPEVIFPVGLPDEGVPHWVERFLAEHPGYSELGGRALLEWGKSSGLWRKAGRGSNDRPDMGFALEALDDLSPLRLLTGLAPSLGRSLVIHELQGNLIAAQRSAAAKSFEGSGLKRVAVVLMGEPPEDYKESVRKSILEEKRRKAAAEAAKKKAEAERKKQLEAKKQKKPEPAKDGAAEGKPAEEGEQKEAEPEPEEAQVELTEEEQKALFKKTLLPDLTPQELAKSFASFSIPEASEGFDEVRFVWAAEARCREYLKEWVLKRKSTQRVEDLTPSSWFKDKLAEWKKMLQDWKNKQTEWKKVLEQLQEWKKEGKKDEDKKDGDEKVADLDPEELDVFKVENINDVGTGEPLFSKFTAPEWTLLERRYELHLLAHAFRKDVDDPERPTFHESHLGFYYNKYYKKPFDLKTFSCESNKEFIEIIKDAVGINPTTGMVEAQLGEDTPLENFVKLAEEDRRDRQRRLDAGDETAELKYVKPSPAAAQTKKGVPARGQAAPRGSTGGGGWGTGGQRSYGAATSASRSYGASTGASASWRSSSASGVVGAAARRAAPGSAAAGPRAAPAAAGSMRRENWQSAPRPGGAAATTRASSGGSAYQQSAPRSAYASGAAASRSYHAPSAPSTRQAYSGGGGAGTASKRVSSYSSGAAPAKQARTGSYSSYGSGGGGGGRW